SEQNPPFCPAFIILRSPLHVLGANISPLVEVGLRHVKIVQARVASTYASFSTRLWHRAVSVLGHRPTNVALFSGRQNCLLQVFKGPVSLQTYHTNRLSDARVLDWAF